MTEVTAKVGFYLVRTVDPEGVRTHLVGKDKHCTCGGNAKRRCSHIRAVTSYLKSGGDRAPSADSAEFVHDSKPVKEARGVPEVCPICRKSVKRLGPDFWRCVDDSAHYWQWRGEQNGGAIRKFLTQPHPAKQGAFYRMSDEQRRAFLAKAQRQMHTGGYTPHSSGGNGHE